MPRKSQKNVVKRGKKPKKSILNPKFNYSSSSSDDDDDYEEDEGKGTHEPAIPRRSTRKILAVDQYKKLPIIRPRENIKERFGLSTKDAHELALILQSDARCSEENLPATVSEAFIGEIQEVIVPNVSQKLPTKKSKSKAVSNPPISAQRAEQIKLNSVGSNYLEYDLDSEDESFLRELNKRSSSSSSSSKKSDHKKGKLASSSHLLEVSDSCFEEMIAMLETEFENLKWKLKEHLEQEIPHILTRKFLVMGEEILKILSFPTKHTSISNEDRPRTMKVSKKKSISRKRNSLLSTGDIIMHYHQIMKISTSLIGTLHQLLDSPNSVMMDSTESSIILTQPILGHMVFTIYQHCLKDLIENTSATLPTTSRSPLSCLLNGKNFTRRLYDKEFLQSLFSRDHAINLLHSIEYKNLPSSTSISSSHLLNSHQREFYEAVYDYWLEKRSHHMDSFLRSYHILSDDQWYLEMLNLLTITENNSFESFMSKYDHEALCQLRDYFDQINNLLENISKGIKIKKNIIQQAKNELESLLCQLNDKHQLKTGPVARKKMVGNETKENSEVLKKSSSVEIEVLKKRGRTRKNIPIEPIEQQEMSNHHSETKAEPITLKLRTPRLDSNITTNQTTKKSEKENCDPVIDTNKRKRHDDDETEDENMKKCPKSTHQISKLRTSVRTHASSSPPVSPFQARLRSALCSLSHIGTYVYQSLAGSRG